MKTKNRTITLRASKTTHCQKCGKKLYRTHTFRANSFPVAHSLREAWMRVTSELCQEHML